jgi:hypothetical protein
MGSTSRRTPAPNKHSARLTLGVLAAVAVLRDLIGERRARDSTLFLVFSPLALCLAFKVMSEVPGLLFVALASYVYEVSPRFQAARPHLR